MKPDGEMPFGVWSYVFFYLCWTFLKVKGKLHIFYFDSLMICRREQTTHGITFIDEASCGPSTPAAPQSRWGVDLHGTLGGALGGRKAEENW